MKHAGRLVGLAAGVAAGTWGFDAAAERNDGVSVEFSVSAAEIDLISADYGRFSTLATAPGVPLVDDDSSDSSIRYDARISGFDFDLFGRDSDAYVRGAHQGASGFGSSSFLKNNSDNVYVPSGLPDDGAGQESRSIAATGSGTIAVERAVDQTETEIAAGFVFREASGFTPRVEFGYRHSEIDQRINVDRVSVTPVLEEFSTNTTSLDSNCADFSVGVSKTLPLSRAWSFVADAIAGVNYCHHDLNGRADYINGFGTDISNGFEDGDSGLSGHGALRASLVWQLTRVLALGANAYVSAESNAPLVAFQTYSTDTFGNLDSASDIHIDTESRASYGASLGVRLAFE